MCILGWIGFDSRTCGFWWIFHHGPWWWLERPLRIRLLGPLPMHGHLHPFTWLIYKWGVIRSPLQLTGSPSSKYTKRMADVASSKLIKRPRHTATASAMETHSHTSTSVVLTRRHTPWQDRQIFTSGTARVSSPLSLPGMESNHIYIFKPCLLRRYSMLQLSTATVWVRDTWFDQYETNSWKQSGE